MKKLLVVTFSLLMSAVLFAGCDFDRNKSEQATKQDEEIINKEQDEEPALEEGNTNMANPMVPIDDDNEFENSLGIPIHTEYMPGDVDMYIISGELAHVSYMVKDPEGRDVECTLRATKNDEDAKNPIEMIAGIYAQDLSEVVDIDVPSEVGDPIIFHNTTSPSDNFYNITYWDYQDAHYTFVVEGQISQMTLSALYDSSLMAIGAIEGHDEGTEEFAYIEPLPYDFSDGNVEDGIYHAEFDSVKKDGDIYSSDVKLYTMDLYDMVEMSNLKIGDIIVVDGEELVINTLEDSKSVDLNDGEGERNVIYINGSIEEGGAEFIAYEGGTYRYFGMDDYATYTEQCEVALDFSKDAVLNDTSDNEHPDGMAYTIDQLEEVMNREFDPGFDMYNCKVRIEGGQIVEIERWFTP